MIFLWLSPLFIAVNAYYIYEVFNWLNAIESSICRTERNNPAHKIIALIRKVFACLWSLASISIYIAFLLPRVEKEKAPILYALKRILKLIGNYHLGVFIYMGMALLVLLVCRMFEFVYCKVRRIEIARLSMKYNVRRSVLGLLYVSFVIFITLFGVHKAGDIKTSPYDITIHKSGNGIDELKIVMVADLHLGYNIGCRQISEMVSLINAENPDIVIIAGDIFDNEFEALDDPEMLSSLLASINSRYGTYSVYGNHDVSEKIIGGFTFNWKDPSKGSSDEMDGFIKSSGITLLSDEYILIDDSFYIYGRPDYEKPGKNIDVRKAPDELTESLDKSKPIIVIDHEPRELQDLADAGVDLDLCGHTHDGQFFPMNLTSRYFTWENSAGLLMKDNMANIVTSGVGLFGPNIRIGTQAEICSVTVHFE